MSVIIEIDDEVYNLLGKEARPFVDSPNEVLRRLLGVDEAEGAPAQRSQDATVTQDVGLGVSGEPRTRGFVPLPQFPVKRRTRKVSRRAAGEMLPLEQYCAPILLALQEAEGEMRSRDVPMAIEPYISEHLRPADTEIERNGLPAWYKRVGWAGTMCRKAGHIDPDSPRGRWRITNEGRRIAESAAKERIG